MAVPSLPASHWRSREHILSDDAELDECLLEKASSPIHEDSLSTPHIAWSTNRPTSIWRRILSIMSPRQRRGHPRFGKDTTERGEESSDVRIRRARTANGSCSGLRLYIVFSCAIMSIAFLAASIIDSSGILDSSDEHDTFLPHWGQPGHMGEGLARYPTDFTRDVHPIPCHSHNDYSRRIPLYEAIHYGFTSVEADVWLHDEELYIGHNAPALTKARTLRSLYVDPIISILEHQNPSTEFSNGTRLGVFEEDPEQTLVLLIDLKTEGYETLPVVQAHLKALREGGYLTYFNGTAVVPGPVTVVATGNTPFDLLVANSTYRDIFFDAPLDRIWRDSKERADFEAQGTSMLRSGEAEDAGLGNSGIGGIESAAVFTPLNSFYASVDFKKVVGWPQFLPLNKHQVGLIRSQIKAAQKQGLKVRYWGTPGWPVGLRNSVWQTLMEEGADYLNADDLKAAAASNWSAASWLWFW